jgi:hypothetical protein
VYLGFERFRRSLPASTLSSAMKSRISVRSTSASMRSGLPSSRGARAEKFGLASLGIAMVQPLRLETRDGAGEHQSNGRPKSGHHYGSRSFWFSVQTYSSTSVSGSSVIVVL